MTTSFDAIVIGAGQAGPFLAVRLAKAGMRTALIEREHLGGTCVNDGCIPTKTLVASARSAQVARRAGDYGVVVGGPIRVDMGQWCARKDDVVAQSIDGLTRWLAKTDRLRLIRGHARFTGAKSIEVNGEALEAAKIFINVGGRAVLPSWHGIADVPVLTNVSMMALDTLPEHLIVAGGSYIGLEFAQMYRRFGSRVTVVEYGERLIAREDPDVSHEVQAILEREGIAFHFSVRDARVALGPSQSWHPHRDRTPRRHAHGRRQPPVLAAVRTAPEHLDDLGPDKRRRCCRRQGLHQRRRRGTAHQLSTASGRSATPTAAARSRTPRSMTTRSSPTTCCTAASAASVTAWAPTRSSSTRRSVGSA